MYAVLQLCFNDRILGSLGDQTWAKNGPHLCSERRSTGELLEHFSSRVSVDQDLSVIVAEIVNDDDVKQRLVPDCFSRERDTAT